MKAFVGSPASNELAGVCAVAPCKWCGEYPSFWGLYLDREHGRVIVVYACEIHSGHLTEMIDGLTDGKLAKALSERQPARETMN